MTPVAVSGIGLVTPAGVGAEATWRGVRDGVPTASTDPVLAGLAVDFCCRIEGFVPDAVLGRRLAGRTDRLIHLLLAAVKEAVADAGWAPGSWDGDRVAVVVGCGAGGLLTRDAECVNLHRGGTDAVSPLVLPKSLPNMAAGEAALALGARGPSMTVMTACASGASAVVVARDLLLAGRCDVAIAAGTEARPSPLTAVGFHRLGTLSRRNHDPATASRPFDRDRDGFVLAEGAGVLVLERPESVSARRAMPRALLSGCGTTTDAHHPTAPHPEGLGAERALRAALRDGGLAPHHVDHVNAHGSSTRLNDLVEARVLCRVLPHGPSVTSAKGALGHSLGASGAIEAALTVLTLQEQLVPPTANLQDLDPAIDADVVHKAARPQEIRAAVSNSFGFGGHNVTLLFTRA
ncbi:beta-ketoacyl-[acyl-carrier-protein] synthase family protein [Streptomyces abikoensis]|uniref:Beta-ketoacyl-[acyl-carrier-protein] synthase family protein n=1 Tax=Streptomyces abikoensis TaxID=97398 RepID=A0ABW7TCN8_9ACTN